MANKPTAEELKKLLAIITNKPASTIASDADFRGDLGLDSLGALDFLVSIEEQYGIVVSQEDATGFKNINDVMDYLAKLP